MVRDPGKGRAVSVPRRRNFPLLSFISLISCCSKVPFNEVVEWVNNENISKNVCHKIIPLLFPWKKRITNIDSGRWSGCHDCISTRIIYENQRTGQKFRHEKIQRFPNILFIDKMFLKSYIKIYKTIGIELLQWKQG